MICGMLPVIWGGGRGLLLPLFNLICTMICQILFIRNNVSMPVHCCLVTQCLLYISVSD